MSEIFRIYLSKDQFSLMGRVAARRLWRDTVVEQGGTPLSGVTLREFGDKIVVIGRADRSRPSGESPDCGTTRRDPRSDTGLG